MHSGIRTRDLQQTQQMICQLSPLAGGLVRGRLWQWLKDAVGGGVVVVVGGRGIEKEREAIK